MKLETYRIKCANKTNTIIRNITKNNNNSYSFEFCDKKDYLNTLFDDDSIFKYINVNNKEDIVKSILNTIRG